MELTEFILTTTYMTYRGQIYNQKSGTAMGSPVSPVIANIVMEHLEQIAIATAPLNCKPRLFKRYVDDILEIVQRGTEKDLTDHLNQVDDTGNLKFTFETEEDGRIPFLDTLIVRKPDKSVKLLIYRKPTLTDQYLNFKSAHPLHHKLGVIRTLLDRKERVVTEPDDKIAEEQHIKTALKVCGYPQWSFDKVKQLKDNPKPKTKAKTTTDQRSRAYVTLPYIKGTTERVQRILRAHNISSTVKPHTNLRNMLVHTKDKLDIKDKVDVVYEIPCESCTKTYVGETCRKFETRRDEHKKETDKKMASQKYTRASRKQSFDMEFKSAVAEHAVTQNHVINWDASKILARDNYRTTRQIRESIWIRRRNEKTLMNGDEGPISLVTSMTL